MAKSKAFELFRTGKHNEAVYEWKKLLEENAWNKEVLAEVEKGRNDAPGLAIEAPLKKKLTEGLDLLHTFYRVSGGTVFREKKGQIENGPAGDIRIHPDGRLVVTNEIRHEIQFFSSEGEFLSSFGEKGSLPGQFNYPKKAFCGPCGSIYVADAWNHRVQKFNRDGVFLGEFGGYGDETGRFNEPHGIAVGGNNWIYVLDRCNNRVQVFDQEFKIIGSFGRRGTPIEEDMAYLFSIPPEKFSPPAFEFPTAIEADQEGCLYIADCNNHRIQKFNSHGSKILEWGKKGRSSREFMYPQAIAIDPKGNIFIADMNNRRVQRFTPAGEFVYAIKMPGSESDAMSVPVSLACGEGKLYVGLGFSPAILVFDYQPGIPQGLREWRPEKEDADRTWPVLAGEKSSRYLHDFKSESFPREQLHFAERLGEAADSIEEKIIGIKNEWEKLAGVFLPSGEKRTVMVLNGVESDLQFDETLFNLERKNIELERSQKANMARLKRAYEHIYSLCSKTLYKSGPDSIPELKNFYAHWLVRTRRLSLFLADLVSQREKIFHDLEGAYKIFVKDQREGRAEFKKAIHLLDGGNRLGLVSQMPLILCLALSMLKDWAVFLKKNSAENSEWERLFQEIFIGETGAGLETVLNKSGPDSHIYSLISNGINILATAFQFAGIGSSCLIPASFSGPSRNNVDEARPALFPLLFPFFLGDAEGCCMAGPYYYEYGPGLDSEEAIQSAAGILKEFAAGGENIASPLKSFMENELVLIQHKVEIEGILNSGAAAEERVFISQTDRMHLFYFQERLNYSTAEKLFINLKWDYRHLFPAILLIKKYGPEKLEEVLSSFRKSLGFYKNLHEEFRQLQREKQKEFFDLEKELTGGGPVQFDMEKKKECQKKKRLNEETQALVGYLQNRLAEIISLHERLNELAGKSIPADRQVQPHAGKSIKIEPDLTIGEPGTLYGQLFLPSDIKANGKKELVVCGFLNHKIKSFSLEGIPIGELGGYGTMPMCFIKPIALALDMEGNAYVAEASIIVGPSNKRVQKISSQGEHVLTIGGANGILEKPTGILIDDMGRLWIADLEKNRIFLYSRDGGLIKTIGKEGTGPGEFSGLWGVTQMGNGDIVVSESANRRIQVLDREGNHKTYCRTEGLEIENVYKLAQGPEGILLASDFTRHCVYVFDSSYRLISTFGGYGKARGEFDGPTGMVCLENFLFVCDYGNHRIQRFNTDRLI